MFNRCTRYDLLTHPRDQSVPFHKSHFFSGCPTAPWIGDSVSYIELNFLSSLANEGIARKLFRLPVHLKVVPTDYLLLNKTPASAVTYRNVIMINQEIADTELFGTKH